MILVRPSLEYLSSYTHALERGWSPDNLRAEAAAEELQKLAQAPHEFLASLDDADAKGAPIRLPDGSLVPRLPGFRRWIWDGEFCGSIGVRWSPGTVELPEWCLGHVGYSVVPWKRRRGYASAALAHILPDARSRGLPYVELTTEPDNLASQHVIIANGGVLIERFTAPQAYGGGTLLRFRVATTCRGS